MGILINEKFKPEEVDALIHRAFLALSGIKKWKRSFPGTGDIFGYPKRTEIRE